MLAAGYRPVGKDFPVFLHPDTGEEYALARTERKTGKGYHGFTTYYTPDVSLEDDLLRRDLTINAMAQDPSGQLIDPYGGLADLQARRLRHVSDAFFEDPLRVLRTARFLARLAPLGFQIADETFALMQQISHSGELTDLTPERVWLELSAALGEPRGDLFIETLHRCGALKHFLPEIDCLFGIPQPPRWHPEIDTGVHTLMVMQQAQRQGADIQTRFAALMHDIGKGLTPPDKWPSHRGHEHLGAEIMSAVCHRLRAPRAFTRLATVVAREHLRCHRAAQMQPAKVLRLLEATGALAEDPDDFERFLLACECDARGRTNMEHRTYEGPDYLRACATAAKAIQGRDLLHRGLEGPALGEALRRAREDAIRLVRQHYRFRAEP
jgi:tRNA nucleotidyltransferase (CCA-adding enzyme)